MVLDELNNDILKTTSKKNMYVGGCLSTAITLHCVTSSRRSLVSSGPQCCSWQTNKKGPVTSPNIYIETPGWANEVMTCYTRQWKFQQVPPWTFWRLNMRSSLQLKFTVLNAPLSPFTSHMSCNDLFWNSLRNPSLTTGGCCVSRYCECERKPMSQAGCLPA